VTFSGTSSLTTNLWTNAGDDLIELQATGAGTKTNVDAGTGTNSIVAGGCAKFMSGVADAVDIAGHGSDSLLVTNAASTGGVEGTRAADSVKGFGMAAGLTYHGFSSLQVALGFGADNVTVLGTAAIPTSINTGSATTLFRFRRSPVRSPSTPGSASTR
jgi:hypothetical protein